MWLLGVLFVILIMFLVFVLSLLGVVASILKWLASVVRPQHYRTQEGGGTTRTNRQSVSKKKDKVFADNEGEYVEFEEIK